MFTHRSPFVEQLNDISFWFPIVEKLAYYSTIPDMNVSVVDGKLKSTETKKDFILRVPKSNIFYAPHIIGKIADGEKTPEFDKLVEDVSLAHSMLNFDSFLRTGQTSNKHDWVDTCRLTRKSDVLSHIYRLIEFSMMVDVPYSTFAVREIIPTDPIVYSFNQMPIAREVRVFAKEGKVLCSHPYWPTEALENDIDNGNISVEDINKLQEMPDMKELNKLAEYISNSFQGSWSIDFLQDKDGNWWMIDMALASTSYHWDGCDIAKRFK